MLEKGALGFALVVQLHRQCYSSSKSYAIVPVFCHRDSLRLTDSLLSLSFDGQEFCTDVDCAGAEDKNLSRWVQYKQIKPLCVFLQIPTQTREPMYYSKASRDNMRVTTWNARGVWLRAKV